ncbi:MAG TPA: hypothetical protein VM452_00905 [Caulifigura sp.]|jgi:D-alanine-D-alanine ligase|nr:hypothetical protein [Caulifigura sp.]
MHVAILHQFVPDDASPDERDVLVQVDAISKALEELGHTFDAIACTLDLGQLRETLTTRRPDVVFNLVESLAGTDSLQCLVPLVVESLGLPMTGSSAAAILNSGSKGFAKSLLRSAGLPTPAWYDLQTLAAENANVEPGRYILKPELEHASLGMTDADVVEVRDKVDLLERLKAKQTAFGRPVFAEAYIEGREFNLSLIAGSGGVEVLPPAEIRFVDFPAGKPKIVGSAAKWDEASFEYAATVRTYDLGGGDAALVAEMKRIATECWRVLDLAGYARVDFRVDEARRPWILEANANPCLSPDAGFQAAAAKAGRTPRDVVADILQAALG